MEIKRTGIALLSFLLLGIPGLAQVVEFNLASQSGLESVGTFTVSVQLDVAAGSDIDVPFTLSGSATEGVVDDYTITTSPVTITAGLLSTDIIITVNDDIDTESGETVEITLGTPSLGSLGTTTVHIATIDDNDTPPVVTITSPADPTTEVEGTSITFTATATDVEEGDLAGSLSWDSDLDGNIGNGGSFSTTALSVGTHVITASVMDGGGLLGSNVVNVTVTAPNAAPTIAITAPPDGHTVVEGTNINFTGTADDAEDGDISTNIDWNSDQDGDFDTGASVNISNLSVNTHTITASITDSESITTTAQITVTITANTAPTVSITLPAAGTSVDFGTNLTFTGTANDAEEGDLSANLSWTSDLDGGIGNGASFSTTGLTVGTHVITASVTDGGGLPGSENITVTINNTAPVVAITTPADPTTEVEGTSITFTATATDAEEGDLAGSLSWDSDLDGNIGNGGSFNTTALSVGTHVITASVTDGGGLPGSDVITVTVTAPNAAPTITIDTPADGHTVVEGTNINFTGTANDAEDGDLTSSINWNSDQDGDFDTGASVNISNLSVNTHTITASIIDSESITTTAQITVTITANTAPTVTITAPADGTSEGMGTSISFTGTADDAEDGNLSASLSWESDLDGNIGNGASFSTSNLSVGMHIITATVIDGNGLEGNDVIIVEITNTPPTVTITDPTDGTSVEEGTNITFIATADDTEEGDLSPGLTWIASLDGGIGSGASISTAALSVGTQTITASVLDGGGLEGDDEISVTITAPNVAPTITIDTPADGHTVVEGTNINFTGTANDAEDGDISANIVWNSDQDGDFDTGASVNIISLSVNTHTITASITDTESITTTATITVTITANQLPTVTITAPTDGTSVVEDTDLTFTGTADDVEDGDLTASLSWDSDLDGNIGASGTFNFSTLSIGTHTITASVTDSHGAPGSDNITVTITANLVPLANFVTITGSIVEGQTLTGNYNYSDPENDPEGVSTFRWLRDGVAITGALAVAQTYTLVSDDVGAEIIFEVTPVASVGASPGVAVQSPFVGPIVAANSPPTNITLSDTDIAENQPINTVVGTLTTDDPDVGDTHTYSLVSGNGSNDNASFNIVGDQLLTSAIFNFEVDPTLNIRIQTEDAAGETFSEALVISVTDVNDPPVAVNDLDNNTTESTSIIIDVVNNDTDEDGTIVASTVSIVSNASDGNAVANGDGTITYTPNNGFTGGDSFTYTVEDNLGATSNQASVVITVGPNSPPVANDDLSNTTDEDTPISINVIANDTDSDGSIDPTSVNILAGGLSLGTAVANNDGTVTYTPNPDATGNDSFTYQVDDNLGATSNVAQVDVSITPVNDPPVANDDAASTPEDIPVTIDVIINDTDIDGTIDPATVNIVNSPSNGSLLVNTDGTVTYTPDPGYNGQDSFSYNVRDDQDALSNEATVTITVDFVNDSPVANNDTNNETEEETPITIDVAANDTDSDGMVDPTTVAIVTDPGNGSLVNNGDGTVTYTPDMDFSGSDSFTYTVQDDLGAISNIALVIVLVTDVNDPPIATDDPNNSTNEDEAITINLTDNDIDLDGTIDVTSIVISTDPLNGVAVPLGNGTVTYTPNPDFNGSDTFNYTVLDNDGAPSNAALVSITVNDINDPPVAVNDDVTTEEDTSIVIDVLLNDSDIDGTLVPSTLLVFSNPGNGTVVVNADGTFTYTPEPDFNGADNFTYRVEDDDGAMSNVALVTITINDINDPPIANDDIANTDEDKSVTINLTDNDTDVDGTINEASIVIITDPSNGTVVVNTDGTVQYTPDTNFNGLDTFDYTVEDDDGALSNIAQVNVSVKDVNDALVANDDDVTTDEDIPVLINVLANDVDSDGSIDPSTVSIVTSPCQWDSRGEFGWYSNLYPGTRFQWK